MNLIFNKVRYGFLLLVLGSCIEPYNPPAISSDNKFLVVEGYINSDKGVTQFKLSRTKNNASVIRNASETGATVTIEGDNNQSYTLREGSNGNYISDTLLLDLKRSYRLRINTKDSKEYLSDYVGLVKTPDIDSVSWDRSAEGVKIYVTTHDPTNSTWYYQWSYQETWEFHSVSVSTYIYLAADKIVRRKPEEMLPYVCWQSNGAPELLLGSSSKLSQDIIYLNPLISIPHATQRLGVKYSVQVSQFGLSKNQYEFLQKLKRNTELGGTLFDPLPSELKGNIVCLNNPKEPVIGNVSSSSLRQRRIFIERSQVPDWGYTEACGVNIRVPNSIPWLEWYFEGINPPGPLGAYKIACEPQLTFDEPSFHIKYMIDSPYVCNKEIVGWVTKSENCLDCTKAGGSTMKPSFW